MVCAVFRTFYLVFVRDSALSRHRFPIAKYK